MAANRRRTERSESAAHSRAHRSAAFPTSGAAKTAPAGRTLARRQKPPRRAPVLRAAVRKNKRGKTPRPNSWTEASAPAANRAERERRRNCAQSKYVRIVGTKKEQQKRCPTAHIAFRAQRTPCRAAFCSPLLRPGGRKKARPPGAPLRGGKSPRAAICGRLLEKNKRGKNSAPE